MPRPKRDYRVSIQADIEKLDAKIKALLIERLRKTRMLDAMNTPVGDEDVEALLPSTLPAKPGRKRRPS